MGYIKEDEINTIRQNADIVDIISSYLPVSQKGRNYVTVCPFHDDHSPSLVISRDRQMFNCFTCRTGGNVFSFIMKYENVDFVEATKIVANKIGYNLKIDSLVVKSENKEEYDIMDIAKKFYINNINTEMGIEAKKYLFDRGINEEIIKEFNIGYSPTDNTLNKLLQSKKYSIEAIDNLGLINKSGIEIYDAFNNRIMIPIENFKGQVVGFTGRIFHNEDQAKYINTKETSIFKKNQLLFNYHNARNHIRNEKKVIVVEGNMDAIKVSASGIKNVVALMGVALSKEQIDTLKRLKVPVILILDNDSAGLDATVKLGELLISEQVDTQIVRLTGAKDPDEYIRKFGVDALRDNINHAVKYIDFKLDYLKLNKNLDNMEDLIVYVKEVVSSLKIVDDLTKELVISKISKDYGIDVAILKNQLDNIPKTNLKKEVVKSNKKRNSKYTNAANMVLFGMMNDPSYVAIYKNKLGYFKEKIERMIAAEIVYYNNEYGGINIADFITYIMDNKDICDKVMEIISVNGDQELNNDEFNEWVDVVLNELKKDEIKILKEDIKKEMDINKKIELLERLTEIKKGSVE